MNASSSNPKVAHITIDLNVPTRYEFKQVEAHSVGAGKVIQVGGHGGEGERMAAKI